MASSSAPRLRELISVEMDPAAFREYLIGNGYDESITDEIDKIDFREIVAREIQRKMATRSTIVGKRAGAHPFHSFPVTRLSDISKEEMTIYANVAKRFRDNPITSMKFRKTDISLYDRLIKPLLTFRQLSVQGADVLSHFLQIFVGKYLELKRAGFALVSPYLLSYNMDVDTNDNTVVVHLENGLDDAVTELAADLLIAALLQLYPEKVAKIAELELTVFQYSHRLIDAEGNLTEQMPRDYHPYELVLLKRFGDKYLDSQKAYDLFDNTITNDLLLTKEMSYRQNYIIEMHPPKFYRALISHISSDDVRVAIKLNTLKSMGIVV